MVKPVATFEVEDMARARGLARIAGVDEAGRGPLAGPVVAAAVIIEPGRLPTGLADSKTLTARRRMAALAQIEALCDVGVGLATVAEIDSLNILRASHLAMCRAVENLRPCPDHVLCDGNMIPGDLALSAEAVIRGDARSLSIAAASIVAKTRRDAIMVDLAQQHPGYGWDRNAGYPSKSHIEALRNLGPTSHHRRSFRPVREILYQRKT